MCGKFTLMATWAEVYAFSQPLVVKSGEEVVVSTPMRFAKIMNLNAAGERELVPMRWGFAGKDDATPSRPRHMHARAETIDKLPTFRTSFAKRAGKLEMMERSKATGTAMYGASLEDVANGRSARTLEKWSAREIRRLKGTAKANMSLSAMADALERAPEAIRRKCQDLGLRRIGD